MILLDTNVLSEFMRLQPDARVLAWVDAQPAIDLVISSISVAEVLHGIARLAAGKRKQRLQAQAMAMFEEDFAGRILPFDALAAVVYAELVAEREAGGRPPSVADAQIMAIAKAHGASIATRNVRDFEQSGVLIINPWIA
ncbi:type II toxin-antitoxin system VapC family toxin [Pseudomonas gingeri]|uniref:type II toxin-antitoxin system VapC family toxin n=1 Tax=Pseudomonas gingeri TaxID=117681 RepID=UPI0015A14AF1|nr:type II toxin-antitoxin system VapC family toxin [Pseudomonas gingeri]NVZ28601.1 type II toxin-antitoxin system VapC family toxin [Pseudomonas gingeri]NVZ62700.1 type II toxin-antitoxin system VapC family toxin [Pseudomonas gingeri]NVZ78345.1 type II toxin-antitoxin system VapC family toxin [Pseudomonas gingeri]NWE69889.1 type II toxin-antitoxin system VapC family toxin [Pseudomonas gingeri]